MKAVRHLSFSLAMLVLAPASGAWAQAAPEPALSAAYSQLSMNRTPSASDKTRLAQALSQLKTFAHPLPPKSTIRSAPPALHQIKGDIAPLITLLEQSASKRSLAQSQYAARRILQQCAGCHASQTKPQWARLAPQGLNPLEAAEFYVLSGNTSNALLNLEKLISDPNVIAKPDAWQKAATQAVALAIETSGGPFVYVDIVSNLLTTSKLNPAQKTLLNGWRVTGKAWGNVRDQPSGADAMYETARHLIASGDDLEKKLLFSGLVHHARAMHLLRRVQLAGAPELKARAYLLAGQLREKLNVSGVWLNPEDYYEACIRVAPGGAEAGACWVSLNGLGARNRLYAMDSVTQQQLQTLTK